MKDSHLKTPRTLDECHFTYGYVSVKPMAYRKSPLKDALYAVLGVAVFAGIGVMLAWRG